MNRSFETGGQQEAEKKQAKNRRNVYSKSETQRIYYLLTFVL